MQITIRCALAALALVLAPAAAAYRDVLQVPAEASALASRTLLLSVARAGERLVAVGQRGHVLVSDDHGATWRQSKVPVSSDLTAVCFADDRNGWAVGHDGVILHSDDGGASWKLQLDGFAAANAIFADARRAAGEEPDPERARKLMEEARLYEAQGADKPFLDVWFADAREGFAVGAYDLLFHTVDGGAHWESWFERADNPKRYNLHAIRRAGGELYVAGEAGLVLRLDRAADRFRAVATPYTGSYFGIVDAGDRVLFYGLRGNVYAMGDDAKTWKRVDAGLAGSVFAAARLRDGRIVLADAGGNAAASADGGRTFAPLALEPRAPVAGLAEAGDGLLLVVGPRGATAARVAR